MRDATVVVELSEEVIDHLSRQRGAQGHVVITSTFGSAINSAIGRGAHGRALRVAGAHHALGG